MNVALVTAAAICLMILLAGAWLVYQPAALIILGAAGLGTVLTVAFLKGDTA